MKAIILVAGKGSRLAPYTDDRPKCLIQVGGRSILDHQLDALAAAGVTDVVLVVGCMQEKVRGHLAGRQEFSFTYIENERFGETNTAYSLWLARWEMTDDFIYLNGDVLIHPEVVRRLAGALASEALAVERKPSGDEEVKAQLVGCRITALSKTVSPANAYGEFIGVARFSRRFGPAFRASLEQVVERDQLLNVYFELALERMLSDHELTAVDISDLPTIEIDFPEDLQRAEQEILPRLITNRPPSGKILFYCERNLHVPFLEPVFDAFTALGGYELAWSTVPYREPADGLTGVGLAPQELQRLMQKGRFIGDIASFCPDVTVCADACTYLKECGKLVFVGHGMISKGGFYTDSELVRRENRADLICVPGPFHRDILRRNVFSPIAVTGFIKSDTLHGPAAAVIRADFLQRYAIPTGKRVILFAPTFNEELSAIPCVGEQIAELCDDRTILLIKLHTMTDLTWVRRYRGIADSNPAVRFIDDIDASPAMLAADLMISDVSSVVLEFMFLDRPVIVVNNPRMREYPYYLPDDIEYRVRDACLQVENMAELKAAVTRSWANPDELSPRRQSYAAGYSYGRDGGAVRRVVQAIRQLQDGGFDAVVDKPSLSIIACWDTAPAASDVRRFLEELGRTLPDTDWELHCIGPLPADRYEDSRIGSWRNTPVVDGLALNKCIMLSRGEYVVMVKPSLTLPKGWGRWMSNHFRFNHSAGAVVALTSRHNYRIILDQVFPEVVFPDFSSIASALLDSMLGRSIESEILSGACMMTRKKQVLECGGFEGKNVEEALTEFGRKLLAGDRHIIQALDVFCY